ncbi:MBL fold metallo-hydrolase [Pseudonocardia spinosispora]|uniref:MBL fold metallo-hydrolase n=1 Tax=Pseudonocardia spinosispora TaxID=103441 RepID=UPI00048FDCFC|nr:MBL fold metallo-hydrolase [Pseudonocardia spinosispora]
MTGQWLELADGVFARRYQELDLTVGLVCGTDRALVIDTRGDAVQGAELAAAVRELTSLPLAVAITHAHFDHCFGTSAFVSPTTPIYAYQGCRDTLRATAEAQRAEWSEYYRARGEPAVAEALGTAEIVSPDTEVTAPLGVELGGRRVTLLHPGLGHTDHDLAVHVPDARVVFAGDLVEHGAPPDFGDALPLEWPAAVEALLALDVTTLVPGHGDPMSRAEASEQHRELTAIAELYRSVATGDLDVEAAVAASPYPEDTTRTALRVR